MQDIIKEYIDQSTWKIKENANFGFSLSGLKSHVANHVLKKEQLNNSPAADYHKTGALHIHDLSGGSHSPYCYGSDLMGLLMNGVVNPTGGSSEAAKHLDVIVDHIVNYIYISQNEWEGAQAFSFHPNTPITIRRNGIIETYPLETLFKMYEYDKQNIEDQEVIFTPFKQSYSVDDIRVKHANISMMDNKFIFQKDKLEVLDGNKFVTIKAISRHKSIYDNDQLLKIQTESGKILMVTKSHPMILKHNKKLAKDLEIGDELITIKNDIKIDGNISLNKNFGWLLGMMIAEGGFYGHQVHITQKDTTDIVNVIKSLGMNFSELTTTNQIGSVCKDIAISSTSLGRIITSFFGMRKYAWNKNLPSIILNCDIPTIGSIISGYIDGDGGVTHYNNKASMVRITSTSYTLLSQIQFIFDSIGINSTISITKTYNDTKNDIISKHDVFVMRFRINEEYKEFFKTCKKINGEFIWKIRDTPKKTDKIVKINECLWQPEYVYDITTESQTFTINNLLVHNSNFDTLLAPFVCYDNLSQKQVKQNLQRMVYNLSYPLRAAFQSPFSNLSFDLTCPDHMKNEPVVIGGEPMEETYGDFQHEMDMINLGFLDVMLEGDRDGRPHTFPIPTYSITEDFDWDCEVTNRLFELTAKFGLPYFMNYCGTGLNPESQRAMCCRLQMDLNEIIDLSKGGWWNTGVSTGSLGVVSINMPQLGYLINKDQYSDLKAFYDRLDILIGAAKQHLIYKRKMVEYAFEIGLMPFTREYIKDFSHFFSTIGIIGMNECCLNLFGKPIHECTEFTENVLSHISNRCREFTTETGYPWNFEETPAEGACYSLAINDKNIYPDIIMQGEGKNVYYTNSSHIPVIEDLGLGAELKIQAGFKKWYTGGTLQHLRCPDANPDPGSVKDLIRNICKNTTIPYLAFSKAYSICPECGMSDDLSGICPKCYGISDVYARVTGFYQPVRKYNKGKAQEFIDRKRRSINEMV